MRCAYDTTRFTTIRDLLRANVAKWRHSCLFLLAPGLSLQSGPPLFGFKEQYIGTALHYNPPRSHANIRVDAQL